MAIALLTDFGMQDAYVASLKAVLLSLAPQTPVIDISHGVPAFDRMAGGLLLFQSYSYFPAGTIFIVVVDPGVGSARLPILVESEKYFFLAPDNGVLSMALHGQSLKRIIHLTEAEYFLPFLSETFHGRDLFAPVAAHLSLGLDPKKLGREIKDYRKVPEFFPRRIPEGIEGRILAIDHFGNAITNVPRSLLEDSFPDLKFALSLKEKGPSFLNEIQHHYSQGASGKAMMLLGSSHLLEIAVREGSAAQLLSLHPGDRVWLHNLQ